MKEMERCRAKIVCTIGPATESEDRIQNLAEAGMDVARVNFSHGTQGQHAKVLRAVRRVAQRLGKPIAILGDLQGPKMRTGRLKGGKAVILEDGKPFTITSRTVRGTAEIVSTTYEDLPKYVNPGDHVILDNGMMELVVVSKDDTDVHCRVVDGGILGEHKGINLPGITISSPTITEKDRGDIEFCIQHGVDYIALSFVKDPADVLELKDILASRDVSIPVIAKIEKPQAVERLDDILAVSDGVMVARGDLGVELPPEEVPILQKHIIGRANEEEVLVITATQMLESMMHNPRPTRAEASDVANAIFDGTDAVMLSGETSVGRYPLEAVEMMARIVIEAEANMPPRSRRLDRPASDYSHAISHAACQIANESEEIRAIAAFTRSGYTAKLVSKDRPQVPIIAFTPDPLVYRRMALVWGITPVLSKFVRSVEEVIALVEDSLLAEGHITQRDTVVIVAGMPIGSGSPTNFLKLHNLSERRP